ncbi:MAG: MoxR family ATPase [Flavobacteriales bacterium]|nr:MoxR family ATPase [Flavobacteriales bacterium]
MINDQVNNPENSENQDHSSYMPSNDQPASPELDLPLGEAVTPPVSPVSEHAATPEPSNYGFERQNAELLWVAQKVNDVRNELSKYIIGQTEMVDLLMTGIFANGHVLLEGAPGVAKTLSAKVLSKSLNVDFSRIQFTPDMMPSDVLGTSIFNMKESSFSFKKGPIFSNIVLIDEINRAPAKTQAALFEVMEERQITYDGIRYPMEFPFLVIATQNPIDQEGTYNLPEAQLDRFLFKIKVGYPELHEEEQILHRYKNNIRTPALDDITAVFTADEIAKIQSAVEKVIVEDNLVKYIAAVTHKTRNHGKIYLGGSPRASLAMIRSAKAVAAIRGRDFVTPEDIQFVAVHVLNHRLILTPEAEMEGTLVEDVIEEIIKTIEVPR